MLLLFVALVLFTNQIWLTVGGSISDDPREPNAGFMDRIKNWFSDMKAKFINAFSINKELPPFVDTEVFDAMQDNAESAKFVQFGGLFVDPTTLKFDPQSDWGFRLGNWYVIKKNSNDDDAATEESISEPLE